MKNLDFLFSERIYNLILENECLTDTQLKIIKLKREHRTSWTDVRIMQEIPLGKTQYYKELKKLTYKLAKYLIEDLHL